MKTFKSSDLTHKRAEVLNEAKANGVIIQECNTNGEVRCEYVLQLRSPLSDFTAYCVESFEGDRSLWNEGVINGEYPKYKFDNIEKALKEIKQDYEIDESFAEAVTKLQVTNKGEL
jgi:hypothetical protein